MLTLDSSVLELVGVGPKLAQHLNSLQIKTLRDLLYHIPFRYDDLSERKKIADLVDGDEVTFTARVHSLTKITSRRGLSMIKGVLEDDTGKLDVLWFNQPYILYALRKGSERTFSGKIYMYKGKKTLTNPISEEEKNGQTVHTGRLVPVYSVTSELSTRTLRTLLFEALKLTEIPESYSPTFRKEHHLLTEKESLQLLHFPESLDQIAPARRRLAFDEILELLRHAQLQKQQQKKRKPTARLQVESSLVKEFQTFLPFRLSPSQLQAVLDTSLDLIQPYPCLRLIQGEVGSGKTVVAAFALYCAAKNNTQSILLAPTQILATQHFNTLKEIFKNTTIPVELVLAQSTPTLSPNSIVVGTHAVFEKSLGIKPSVVVVDEEHRFGVKQREVFLKGKTHPHLLTMTATPIPRTVAYTMYADRDVTYIEQVPGKEKQIKTIVVEENRREKAYAWIEEEMSKKQAQVFVVCPFIQTSENENLQSVKAAEQEFISLQTKFPNHRIALLHGKTAKDQKDMILQDFAARKIDMLVATPLIEVGIDIPNATIMLIESAERFGLAQLHQLRGRVGRRGQESWCLLFSTQPDSTPRLKHLEVLNNGNELAELDLKLRGTGELFGVRQSGWGDLRFASWFDTRLIQECRQALQNK